MDTQLIYTLIGYAGSVLVIVSLAMTSVLRLRIIGLIGAVTFLVYGVLIGATPVVVTNIVIIGIHGFYLYRAWTDHEYFSVLEVLPTSRYLAEFFEFYRSDISRYFPGFTFQPTEQDVTLLVLRNMIPAGAFVARPGDAGILDVRIDYVIPRYADFKVGRYLFGTRSDFFVSQGWTTIRAQPSTEAHVKYLLRMGFEETDSGHYERALG